MNGSLEARPASDPHADPAPQRAAPFELVVLEGEGELGEGGRGTTRRGMVLRGLLLIAGAVGIGAAGMEARTMAGGASGDVRLRLRAVRLRSVAPGVQPGSLPGPGDDRLVTATLVDSAGRTVGELRTALAPGAPDAVEVQRLVLDDGTLVGLGENGDFAVVGGTGRFAGATGSYVTRPGDDDELELVFDLLGSERR
jgi:hypothetical protein